MPAKSFQSNMSHTPKVVATPFPPLNFNQTDRVCPKIGKSPDKRIQSLVSELSKKAVIVTAKEPFEKSRRKVAIPADFPAIRITFVIPIFPLPNDLTSYPQKILLINNPKGMDPNK